VVVPSPFANITSLGQPDRAWPSKENVTRIPMLVTLTGAAALVLGGVLALSASLPAASAPLLIAGLFLCLGLWNLVRLRGGAGTVMLYQAGFAALVGSSTTVWPWAEIATILSKEKLVRGRRASYQERCYEISKLSGETLLLLGDHFEDMVGLAGTIKERVGAHLLPPLQARYDAGQPLTFGAVTVSRNGIEAGGRRLAWGAVANVVVKDGRLIVTPREGAALKVKASKIPNIEQLGALIGVDPARMDLMAV
jgi:hypothetical protein